MSTCFLPSSLSLSESDDVYGRGELSLSDNFAAASRVPNLDDFTLAVGEEGREEGEGGAGRDRCKEKGDIEKLPSISGSE